ncbi:MAG: ABC transporter ATP-binding protein [Rhodospirillales bacterium]|nr:MAG: ABC transporter ATP-binding protein [Rhodospirillales bacterium]
MAGSADLHEPGFALHVEDLTVRYGSSIALWDIDLDVPPGRLVAIVGPNGSGKSTLLKSVMGLLRPVAGHIRIFGEPISRARSRVAYVHQRAEVDWDFPATVLEVVTMGLYRRIGWLRPVRKAHRQAALEALAEVGMEAFATRQIGQLSGGQQQRVFIARALIQQADLVLLDEPLAGVDAVSEDIILSLLRSLRDRGKSVVVVHHDLSTVRRRFDWMVLLNRRLIAQGEMRDVYTPANLKAAYGGQMAVFDAADADDPARSGRVGGQV